MKLTRIIACAVIAATGYVTVSHAQSLRNAEPPAEFPASSYKGKQYVDSRGCVYIRAGIDGNVTWVPRVDRARRQICGQSPTTRVAKAPAAAPAPKKVEQITLAPAATPAPAAKPAAKPKPVRVARATPKPAPVRPAPAPVVAAPAPKPAPRAAAPRALSANPACPGASAISRRYINSGERLAVRCGPQSRDVAGHVSPGAGKTTAVAHASAANVAPTTRLIPRHVYPDRVAASQVVVPEGYRPVWEDGRLNPQRGEQNLNGIAQTRLYWTNTVPRRLIHRDTGHDVTARVPLVYPYVDVNTQSRELGAVTIVRKDGQVLKRIVRNTSATSTAPRYPVVSSRSAPAPLVEQAKPVAKARAPKSSATPKPRYIQVGAFRDSSNANAAVQRLARAGLPAKLGKVKNGGSPLQLVLAGPYSSPAAAQTALRQAKQAGFTDAFLR